MLLRCRSSEGVKEPARPRCGCQVVTQWWSAGERPRQFYSVSGERRMNNVIYIVGLIVVVLAILSFFGLR